MLGLLWGSLGWHSSLKQDSQVLGSHYFVAAKSVWEVSIRGRWGGAPGIG
jgi:hypothetical protein